MTAETVKHLLIRLNYKVENTEIALADPESYIQPYLETGSISTIEAQAFINCLKKFQSRLVTQELIDSISKCVANKLGPEDYVDFNK